MSYEQGYSGESASSGAVFPEAEPEMREATADESCASVPLPELMKAAARDAKDLPYLRLMQGAARLETVEAMSEEKTSMITERDNQIKQLKARVKELEGRAR